VVTAGYEKRQLGNAVTANGMHVLVRIPPGSIRMVPEQLACTMKNEMLPSLGRIPDWCEFRRRGGSGNLFAVVR